MGFYQNLKLVLFKGHHWNNKKAAHRIDKWMGGYMNRWMGG